MNFIKKLWQPTKYKWLLFLPVGSFLALLIGILSLATFQTTMHLSSSNEFCFSCHVGMDTIVEEYKASVHFNNETGVIATCADCHLPQEFLPKMKVKIAAIGDIYHKLTGKITLENFESQRLEMASNIWHELKENDSRECRNCHSPENWRLEKQSEKAQIQHDTEFWVEKNKTCINCHKGVAHLMPLRPGSL